jgi:predicted DsbA family dithiol-disulfide isomerase
LQNRLRSLRFDRLLVQLNSRKSPRRDARSHRYIKLPAAKVFFMLVDLWTDIVCPWCYIGVTRFERARERFNATVDVRLHPFQLDPDAPIPGISAMERYAQRFGNEAPDMLRRVVDEAAKDGIEMRFDRAITGNTFDAHRAVRFASRFGKDRDLEMSLYRAYFTDGLDITDRSVLADRAAAAGLDRDEVISYLHGDDAVEEVLRELEQSRALGISGVPAFVFENQFLVPGAVDTDTFVKIFEQIEKGRR